MGSQIAFAYIGVMLAPPLTGFVTRTFGFQAYPILLAVLYVLMITAIGLLIRSLKKVKRYDSTV